MPGNTQEEGAEDRRESFNVGDIVEIVESSDDDAVGCLGEVVVLGPPIEVAVVHVLSFQPNQLKIKLDLAGLTWNELRANAKTLAVPATGKRPELEAKIKQQLKEKGRLEVTEVVATARNVGNARADGFKTGQRVQVKNTPLRGKVVDGSPRVQVRLDSGRTAHYPPGNLTKLEPIL